MKPWKREQMRSQAGRFVIVTGANSGIGYFSALELARAGAEVVLACRSAEKGRAAEARINEAGVRGRARFERLDLASLDSVHEFAGRIKEQSAGIDILINNAAVMAVPTRQLTADGFELQFGVNFLGHFALTGLLLPALMKAPSPRTVQLSSIAHRGGSIDFSDLQSERGYKPWKAYNQTKLAMLMFALELDRRSRAGGWGITSVAAHPGVARTELMANGPGTNNLLAHLMSWFGAIFTHSGAAGALPVLLAATAPDIAHGGYYGPKNFMEMKGPPAEARISPQAFDEAVAIRLWEVAEQLTGVTLTPCP